MSALLKSMTESFQSPSSVRRKTGWATNICPYDISIPFLRAEEDSKDLKGLAGEVNFNPLPPCGGRLRPIRTLRAFWLISIPFLRAEEDKDSYEQYKRTLGISIPFLRAEEDSTTSR